MKLHGGQLYGARNPTQQGWLKNVQGHGSLFEISTTI